MRAHGQRSVFAGVALALLKVTNSQSNRMYRSLQARRIHKIIIKGNSDSHLYKKPLSIEVSHDRYFPGFQRFLALGELGPNCGQRGAGDEAPLGPQFSAARDFGPALRERETSGTQGRPILNLARQ